MNIKLYYYASGSNFGDAVNPFILDKIFSLKCDAVSHSEAQLFMIGSILGKAMLPEKRISKRIRYALKSPLTVWSSGFIRDDLSGMCAPRKLNVCALRGELSRALLEKILKRTLKVPLGDGGVLISRLLDKLPDKKYAVGIVPHFVDSNLPEIELIRKKIPGTTVISPLGNPLECARKIAECETILSSSLHGLIAADSFGIPNRQIILSNKIVGGLFKYNDYYSVFGKTAQPLMLNELLNYGTTAENIRKSYETSMWQIEDIQERLLSAFPYRP